MPTWKPLPASDADLDANRKGQMSLSQLQILRRKWQGDLSGSIILIVCMTLLWILASLGGGSIPALICLLVDVFLIALVIWRWNFFNQDMREARAASYTGPISLDIQGVNAGRARYLVSFGDEKLEISKEQLLALQNGSTYTVYFAPRTKIFLGADPLFDSDGGADTGVEKPKRDQVVRLGDDGELLYDTEPKHKRDTTL